MVDYNGLENRRTDEVPGVTVIHPLLRFRYSEQTNREILNKNVSIIATSSYVYFSFISILLVRVRTEGVNRDSRYLVGIGIYLGQ